MQHLQFVGGKLRWMREAGSAASRVARCQDLDDLDLHGAHPGWPRFAEQVLAAAQIAALVVQRDAHLCERVLGLARALRRLGGPAGEALHDQFGTSGCVGCGRCITWCPVGIDITEEVRAIWDDQAR